MKILVIEDDEVTAAYIADGLREEGHSVDLIDNSADGLIQASVGRYDVFVAYRMFTAPKLSAPCSHGGGSG